MRDFQEYIQCSACYFPEIRYILTGHRHWSVDMYWNAGYSVKEHKIFDLDRARKFFELDLSVADYVDFMLSMGDFADSNPVKVKCAKDHVQGFFTNEMRFVTREEGWKIARAGGQIIHSIRGEDLNNLKEEGTLFSENLW